MTGPKINSLIHFFFCTLLYTDPCSPAQKYKAVLHQVSINHLYPWDARCLTMFIKSPMTFNTQ